MYLVYVKSGVWISPSNGSGVSWLTKKDGSNGNFGNYYYVRAAEDYGWTIMSFIPPSLVMTW